MTILSDHKTGATLALDQRTALIASLRILANHLEDIPEIPTLDCKEIRWGIPGRDAEALPILEDLQTALSDEGLTHEVTNDLGRSVGVNITLVGGYKLRIVHVLDQAMAYHAARESYTSVVQVDAEQDGAA